MVEPPREEAGPSPADPIESALNTHEQKPIRVPDGVVALLLSLVSGSVYFLTLAPSVVAGNSGEYQYISYILSIAHSTGYPLYTLLGKLFTSLPVGSIAFRMNLLSAIAAVAAVVAVYFMVRQLIASQTFAAAVALTFAFASSFWGAALIAEVHTLNVAFVALDTYLLLRWDARQRRMPYPGVAWRELRWFALAYGLSLTHHRMILLLAPAFAVFVALTLLARPASVSAEASDDQPVRKSWWYQAALTLLLLFAPLLFYAYIPLRGHYYLSQSDPAVTELYENRVPEAILRGTVTAHYRQSWSGFINLVTGRDYAVDVGIESWEQFGERLVLWATTLAEQFSAVGIFLSIIGAIALFRRNWRRAVLLLLGYASVVAFSVVYVGHGQIWYYFMPAYVFLAGFIGVAFDTIWNLLDNRRPGVEDQPRKAKPYILYSFLCFLLPITLLIHNWPIVDMSDHYIDRNRAQDVLAQDMEPGAVILGPWDMVSAIRYYQYAEGVRPDLVVIHADPTYSSGKKIIEKCVELRRPLYLLDFLPVDPQLTTPLNKWVQLTPIPYLGVPIVDEPVAEFGEQIALLGARVHPDPIYLQPGASTAVNVQLFWRALSEPERDYRVFLHLIAPGGTGIDQVDESPASVYYPTSRWRPGQVFRGEYWLTLPPQSPPGVYSLEIGLYDDDGERLSLSAAGDVVRVEGIEVTLANQRGGL